MTTDIKAQQPGTAALLTRLEMFIHSTNNSANSRGTAVQEIFFSDCNSGTADVVGFSLGMFESMWFIAWWAVKCCWIVEWCTHFSISYDNIEYFIFRSLMFKTNNNIRSAKCAARRRWKFTKWVCTHMCHPRTSLATPTLDSAPSQMINIGDIMFLVVAVA